MYSTSEMSWIVITSVARIIVYWLSICGGIWLVVLKLDQFRVGNAKWRSFFQNEYRMVLYVEKVSWSLLLIDNLASMSYCSTVKRPEPDTHIYAKTYFRRSTIFVRLRNNDWRSLLVVVDNLISSSRCSVLSYGDVSLSSFIFCLFCCEVLETGTKFHVSVVESISWGGCQMLMTWYGKSASKLEILQPCDSGIEMLSLLLLSICNGIADLCWSIVSVTVSASCRNRLYAGLTCL